MTDTSQQPGTGLSVTGTLAIVGAVALFAGTAASVLWPAKAGTFQGLVSAFDALLAALGAAKAVKTSQVAKHTAAVDIARIQSTQPPATNVQATTAMIAPTAAPATQEGI